MLYHLGAAMAADPNRVRNHTLVADHLRDLLARYDHTTAQRAVA